MRRKRNPKAKRVLANALTANLVAAMSGGLIGSLTATPATTGMVAGAEAGLILSSVGGLVTAVFNEKFRDDGFATAIIGILGVGTLWMTGKAFRLPPATTTGATALTP